MFFSFQGYSDIRESALLYLEIRIDSTNQILKNKEKVKPEHKYANQNYRPEDSGVYIQVYQITKHWRPGPYNSLCHADNRRYF